MFRFLTFIASLPALTGASRPSLPKEERGGEDIRPQATLNAHLAFSPMVSSRLTPVAHNAAGPSARGDLLYSSNAFGISASSC